MGERRRLRPLEGLSLAVQRLKKPPDAQNRRKLIR